MFTFSLSLAVGGEQAGAQNPARAATDRRATAFYQPAQQARAGQVAGRLWPRAP
jgi:hypothetical protein